MGTGIGFGNGISVAEQQRILTEFVMGANADQERDTYDRYPDLADPNAIRSLELLAALAEAQGKGLSPQVLRLKRQRLIQLQGGF